MVSGSLNPDEIRAIREGLGLTQREAGELLGGGPNAFAKYEGGAVAPSAAVVNLLLLLKGNPGALDTLMPERERPAPTTRPLPFEVTSEHIASITEEAFPEFLRLLLCAEALAHRIPADRIHVADNVRAPDGGEDGRIEWEEGPDRTPYLPGRLNQFQLKTGNIYPAAAGREVLTNTGEAKAMVSAVLESGGHYIVLCTHRYTQQQIEARETSIRDALRGADLPVEDAHVDFRDASHLAAWVNAHPAVAHWLLERAEPGLLGPFRSWSHWAGRAEHEGSPWVEDERLAGVSSFLRERVTIEQPGVIGRLVGLAGVGKSRLVLEALRATTPSETASQGISSLVLYAVESESGSEAIKAAVQKLADSRARALVVVDCCAPQTHQVLARMALRGSSQISLLTIDDELPDQLGDAMLRVDRAPTSVTEAIVDRVAPGLPAADQRRLVQFSQGFPEVAILIARAWLESKPIARATDEELVNAYVLGRTQRDRDLLLKSAALLATFGLVGIEHSVDGQVAKIASLGLDLTTDALVTGARRLADRGVARRRGRYVSIEPRPISMRLAERQWKDWREPRWDEVLTDSSQPTVFADDLSLNVQAAKQLKLLNTLDISRDVVKHVCRHGGPFDGREGIRAPGHTEVLSRLAEIDTSIVAEQIRRSLADVEDLSTIAGDARRHLVWALEKIAFESETFEDGARLLLSLAAAENEDWGNNATGQFVALFPLLLGGTEADGSQRLDLLDALSETDVLAHNELVIKALIAGLELDHFSRIAGPEAHGTRPALESWRPKTNDEAYAYVQGCATRLAAFAIQGSETGTLARSALGAELGSLVRHGFIDVVERLVEQVGNAIPHWPEAMSALEFTLMHPEMAEHAELAERVRTLVERVQPKSLETRAGFLVTDMPWEYLSSVDDDYEEQVRRQGEVVRALAGEAIQDREGLKALLPQLSRGQQRMADVFGKAIAELTVTGEDWLEPLIRAVEEVPEDERNYGLLLGYINGLADRQPAVVDELKHRATQSSALAPILPLMCSTLGTTRGDIDMIVAALQSELLSPRWLTWQTIGRGLRDESPEVAVPLFDAMLEHSSEGFAGALDLLGLFVHGDRDKLEAFRPQIRKIAENALRWPWTGQTHGHLATPNFERIIVWMLERGPHDHDASATAFTLASAVASIEDYDSTHVLEPVLPALLANFPGIAWPIIGSSIVSSEPIRAFLLESLLSDGVRWGHLEYSPPILSLPQDTLFAWCHAHPERAPAFAAKILPFLTANGGDGTDLGVHPSVIRLVVEFGDREDVTQALSANMSTGGWTGPEEGFWSTYQEPMTQLLNHPDARVRRWAKATLRGLRETIEDARVRDAEEEARWGD